MPSIADARNIMVTSENRESRPPLNCTHRLASCERNVQDNVEGLLIHLFNGPRDAHGMVPVVAVRESHEGALHLPQAFVSAGIGAHVLWHPDAEDARVGQEIVVQCHVGLRE